MNSVFADIRYQVGLGMLIDRSCAPVPETKDVRAIMRYVDQKEPAGDKPEDGLLSFQTLAHTAETRTAAQCGLKAELFSYPDLGERRGGERAGKEFLWAPRAPAHSLARGAAAKTRNGEAIAKGTCRSLRW